MVNIKNQRNLCSRCSGWPHPWKTGTELLCARTGDKISLVLPVQLWQSWTNRWAERFSSLNTSKGKGCTSRTHFQEMDGWCWGLPGLLLCKETPHSSPVPQCNHRSSFRALHLLSEKQNSWAATVLVWIQAFYSTYHQPCALMQLHQSSFFKGLSSPSHYVFTRTKLLCACL